MYPEGYKRVLCLQISLGHILKFHLLKFHLTSEDVEKLEPVSTGGKVKWFGIFGKVCGLLKS